MSNAVALRLERFAPISLREAEILQHLPRTALRHPKLAQLCVEGQIRPPQLLLSGWACYQRILGDGRRQIIRFLLPGDAIGSLRFPSIPIPTSAVALTPVTVTDAEPLLRHTREPGGQLSGIAEALARMAHADERFLHDQIVRLGRHTTYERLIHLILELHARSEVVGLVKDGRFPIPFTQQLLGNALGVCTVHLNRMLQQARREKLLEVSGSQIRLLRPDMMRILADWAEPSARSALTPGQHAARLVQRTPLI